MTTTAFDERGSSPLRWPAKADVFGVGVSCVDYDRAVSCIIQAARIRRGGVVSCHAVHAIVAVGGDPSLRAQVNRFAMVTPDGQPVRWALNLLHGVHLADRVYGPELMRRVCLAAADAGVSIYLYGSTSRVLAHLQENLSAMSPAPKIAGAEASLFRELTEQDNDDVCRRINESGAGIVMVGLGCPTQDRFAARNADRLEAVQLCVGAAFDFHAGLKPMAPGWMQRNGLEWLFRLWCEPRRLWRRYLVTNTVFSANLALALMRRPFRRRRGL